jgi:hypothetical protein
VFVSDSGHRLLYWQVNAVFRKLLKSAGLVPASGRAPRLHELRQHADFRIMPTVVD